MKNLEWKARIDYSMKKRQKMIEFNKWKQQNSIISSISEISESNVFATDKSSNDQYYEIFIIAIASSFFASFNYFLLSSWILDNGSDTDICNKSMLHRFWKTRDVSSKTMLTEKTRSNVEIIEEIEISINAFEKKIWKMLFIEICYTSNFMTNIAASKNFRAKKIYFDDQNMRLYVNNKTLKLIKHWFDHSLLKDNTIIADQKKFRKIFQQ